MRAADHDGRQGRMGMPRALIISPQNRARGGVHVEMNGEICRFRVQQASKRLFSDLKFVKKFLNSVKKALEKWQMFLNLIRQRNVNKL